MREAKFRAWDKKEKEMIYEALEIKNIGLGEGSVLVDAKVRKGNELIWQQYTGLTDANGKDVYEGDIITDIEYTGEVLFHDRWYEVGMHAGLLAWCIFDKKRGEYIRLGGRSGGDCVNEYTWEIIGNIYENPELLEEK